MLREKPPIALELGTAYSKLRYAAEAYPRFIIPSEIVTEDNETIKFFNLTDESEFYDDLVEFLKKIFFKYLLVSPRDRKIVIVESAFCPTLVRETLARVLFRHFEVASIFFVPTHLVVLSTLASQTALVVDLGYQETTVVPVYSGFQISYAFQAQDFGGSAIHNRIKEKMLESGVKEEDLSETVVEDIKVRTCFVTTRERALQHRGGNPPQLCRSVAYPNGGKGTITIPGELRETALEVLIIISNKHLKHKKIKTFE